MKAQLCPASLSGYDWVQMNKPANLGDAITIVILGDELNLSTPR